MVNDLFVIVVALFWGKTIKNGWNSMGLGFGAVVKASINTIFSPVPSFFTSKKN
jgi:hypothetical protein